MRLRTHKMILDEYRFFNVSSFLGPCAFKGSAGLESLSNIKAAQGLWSKFQQLTKREKEIFQLLINGCSNQFIADRLCISKLTATTHRKNINKKLDINNINGMLRYALLLDINID